MKILKKLLVILSAIGLTALTAQAAYIYEYGSFDERAEKAVECGIIQDVSEYQGTYEQNIALENCYKGYLIVLEDPYTQKEWSGLFGGLRPTNFKTTLAESLTATASTTEEITLSSVTTKDSQTLTTSDVGDFICLSINQGASNHEIVCCTGGITGTTFNDCTRGYSFKSNEAYAGNAKSHSPGETVIISNDDQYLSEQYTASDDSETIYGLWTYASSTLTRPYLRLGNTTFGDIGYNESLNQLEYRNNAGAWTAIGGGASTYTAEGAISLSSNIITINTSTVWNYDFNLDSRGDFVIRKNNSVTSTADGLSVATTSPYSWTGLHTFSSETTFNSSTTLATSSITKLISNGLVKEYTAGETITNGNAVYTTSTRARICDDDTATSTIHFIGFALNSASEEDTVWVQTSGIYTGQSGLDEGFYYYVSDSGAITSSSTSPTVEGVVGLAIGDAQIDIDTKVGDQFISSITDTSDTIWGIPHWARKAVISVSATNSNGAANVGNWKIILTKNGNKSDYISHQDGSDNCTTYATWETNINKIVLSYSGTNCTAVAGTAYFYR